MTAARIPKALLASCVLAVVIVVLPVAVTMLQAARGGVGHAVDAITASSTLTLLLHTGLVTIMAAPLCLVFGVACAWLIERTELPGRRIWTLLVVAPLTVPLFVTSYAWAALSRSLQGLVGAAGIIGFSYFPIVFLLVAASLRGMDPALEETGRSLGLGARQVFFRVVVPQLRPALLGGMLLVVLDTLVEFDAFVALKYQTFTLDISSQYQLSFSASGAAALSLMSTVICVVLLLGEARLRGNANYTRVSHGARRALTRYRLGRGKPVVLCGLGLLVTVSLGIPVGTLIHWFTQTTQAGDSGASASLGTLGPATVTSVGLGVSSAVVAVVMAFPIAVLAVRHRGAVVTLLERATYLSFALPDLVAAIALAYAASHYTHFLYGSVILLIFADAMLFIPFAVVAIRASLGQVEPVLEESARSLGASGLRTVGRITIPLAWPGIAAAGVLVFAFVLGDLSTAQVLLPPNLSTLGTQFQENSSTVAFAAAAPFAAVLIVLSMIAAYVLMNRFGRVRTPAEG